MLGSGVDYLFEWDMTDDRLDYLFGCIIQLLVCFLILCLTDDRMHE